MATTISELLVKVTPSGIDETSDGLEDVEEQFEDTADAVDESASEMESFSEKFQGSMQAIVSGLAVASAGILSQVPVLNETMTAFSGTIDALAMAIDRDLRPSLQKTNRQIMRLNERVAKADSSTEALKQTFRGLEEIRDSLLARTIQNSLESMTGIKIPKSLAEFSWEFLSMDLIDAITVFKKNWKSWKKWTLNSLNSFGQRLRTNWSDTWSKMDSTVESKLSSIISTIKKKVRTAVGWTNKLPGKDTSIPGSGRKSTPNHWPDSTGPRGGGSLASPTTTRSERQNIRGLNRLVAALQNNQQTTTLEVDGQKVAEQTKPFLGDGTTNRGRFGHR